MPEDKNEVHRLTDMLVKEVSLVDRAANGREFLIIKSHKEPPKMPAGAEVNTTKDGGYTAQPPPPAVSGAGAATAPPAPQAAPPGSQPGAPGAGPVGLTMEVKQAMTQVIAGATAKLAEAQKMIDGASIVPDETQLSVDPLVECLSAVGDGLEDSLYALLGLDPTLSPEPNGAGGPGAPPPPGAGPAVEPPSMAKRLELLKAHRVLAKAAVDKAFRNVVLKYGAKMAKTRLARLKTVMQTLQSIVGEVEPAAKVAPPPPPAAAGGAAPPKDEEKDKPAATAKNLESENAQLKKALGEVTEVAKAATTALSSLRSNIQAPNSLPVERSETAKAETQVSWPSDMNHKNKLSSHPRFPSAESRRGTTNHMTQITPNRSLLEKAQLSLADLTNDGGILKPAQSQQFMRVLIDESKLLPMVTVVPMRSPTQEIDKIRFMGRILRAGQEATALAEGDRSKPTTEKVELSAKLFKGEVRLSNETLEDSIEREELRNTIMQLMAERVGLDAEEVVVKGDTASSDPFLAQFNGILKQATSHIVDVAGAQTTKAVWRDMLKAMPQPFRRNKGALRYLTSGNSEIDYRDSLSDRVGDLSDKNLEQEAQIRYTGIPVDDVPLFPEDTGSGNNKAQALLLDPKNIQVGIWRNIRVETDKLISEGVLVMVVTLRMDVKYAVEDAVVKATNIGLS